MVIHEIEVKEEGGKKLKWHLEKNRNGSINLVCNAGQITDWYVLAITKEGKLDLECAIPEEIGLQVTKEGIIVIDK